MNRESGEIPSASSKTGTDTATGSEVQPDLEGLRAYSQLRLAVADQLRVIREALKVLGQTEAERQCAELVVKLAEDRFVLAVLGQFKRGKSSLMNAIVGRQVLPTGVLPLTSAITVLKYGPIERLVIQRENSVFVDELPLSALADYVTEKSNPGNQKRVNTATLELPIPFLRRGLQFVDTPGVGSAIAANTATAYAFLPECDAVLFVTSVDTPMTSLELDFLKDIREYVDKVFFILNKTDLVAEAERAELVAYVSNTIESQTGHGSPRVFPVSARQGLEARATGDMLLYQQSGLKALEEALVSFLSNEKSAAFLLATAKKALRILDELEATSAFTEQSLQKLAEAASRDESALHRDPRDALASIRAARGQLEALAGKVEEGRLSTIGVADNHFVTTGAELGATQAGYEVEAETTETASLQTGACPVCREIEEVTYNFLARWQYEIATYEKAKIEFARELGFCPVHMWQLVALSSPHGASVGLAMLAEQASQILKGATSSGEAQAVKRMVVDSHRCRVCQLARRSESRFVERLGRLIEEPAGRKEYSRSQGLCLRHLAMLVDVLPRSEDRKFVLSHAAQQLEESAEDMSAYALKRDALRSQLLSSNEEGAYRRAVISLVGNRNTSVS